jgi:hypothetical protein
MSKKSKKKWLSKPDEHDYPAAESYLTLLYDEKTAAKYAKALSRAPMTSFAAKDIFRASQLPLLGGKQFSRTKKSYGNRGRQEAFAAAARQRSKAPETRHRRWLSPNVRRLFL